MGAAIEFFQDHGAFDTFDRYWPWSGLLVLIWMGLLYLYLGIEWWEQKKNKKKVYRILDRFRKSLSSTNFQNLKARDVTQN